MKKGEKTARKGTGSRGVAEAAKRFLEEWTADWRVPYTPPQELSPGLGVPQVFPGIGREDPLLAMLGEAARLFAKFVATRAAGLGTRGAGLVPAAARLRTRDLAASPQDVGLPAHLARLLPPPAGMSAGAARAIRFAQERRKICRRSTVARRPTADEVRAAWRAAHDVPANRLRLGRLLMDLECFVDNDLIVRWYRKRPRIVGRNPGIRGWIAEQCPELVPKYKTLMRYKSMATRARQESGATDPLPQGSAAVQQPSVASVRIQPRRRGTAFPRRLRFAWEHGSLRIDANGRFFLTNENYSRAVRSLAGMAGVSEETGTPTGYNSQRTGRRRREEVVRGG